MQATRVEPFPVHAQDWCPFIKTSITLGSLHEISMLSLTLPGRRWHAPAPPETGPGSTAPADGGCPSCQSGGRRGSGGAPTCHPLGGTPRRHVSSTSSSPRPPRCGRRRCSMRSQHAGCSCRGLGSTWGGLGRGLVKDERVIGAYGQG